MRPLFLFLVLMTAQLEPVLGQETELWDLVVVGNDIGTERLTEKELRDHMNAKRNFWKNGRAVVVVLPAPKSPSASRVAEVIYGKSVTGMQKFWLSVVFQGRSNPPVFTDTDGEMIDYVRKTPGAIGVMASEVPGTVGLRIQIE
jgi:ABC-type phosphate transport system substrate-binding protein